MKVFSFRPLNDLSEASLFGYGGENTALEKSDSLIFFDSGGETKSNSNQINFGTQADTYGFSGAQVNVREEIRTAGKSSKLSICIQHL